MKVVINNCFGGFGLSVEAEKLYARKKGLNFFFYVQTKHSYKEGKDEYTRVDSFIDDNNIGSLHYVFTKDLGETFSEWSGSFSEYYFYSRNIQRDDPMLIEVVEELGELANGSCASLKIIEIPTGIDWQIDEYDGNESVEEVHRKWS